MMATGRTVVAAEGWRGLYSGVTPTLLGVMPYAGLSFCCFETLKAQLRKRWGLDSDRDIPTAARLTVGGVAGLIAQSATYPLDIVRRRMQVAGHFGDTGNRDWQAMISNIMRREGVFRGLYKGLSMNWIKSPVAIAVSFTVNDSIKAWLAGGEGRR